MGVPISNVTRRVVYAASGTGPYAFTFEILANTDIAVYKDDALLTLTTDYTVTIATNGTGSITLTASPTGATQIAIVGNRTIQRTTDFVTGGDFFANTVNDEMDQQTIFAQQNAEGLQRALQAPQTDPTDIDMTLPRASLRANKNLAFDADGNPVVGEAIGDFRGNWASGTAYNKRDIIKDTSNANIYYCNTAHTASGSQPISTNADSAKWTLIVDTATATAAQAAAEAAQAAAETAETNAETAETNAETAATNAASSATAAQSAQTAAEAARDATLAAYDNFDDRYLGAKSSNPTVDNDGNALTAGSLYYNTTVPEMRVYTGSAWVAAYVSGTGFLTTANNLSDLASAATARTNLGLAIGTDVQAYDSDLTTWAGKTAPSGTVVGTTDTQTLSNKTITGTKETVYTITDGAGFEIDPANGGIQVVTLGASRSPAATNFTAGQSMILGIDDGSAYTITWPTITWATTTATAPTLATSGYTWVVLWKVGSTLYGKY